MRSIRCVKEKYL